MDIKIFSLPNGLRVLYKYIPYTRIVHCGYVINVGSRDDRPDELGMTHFLEHVIFKGTPKRKTFHVLNYLESVGGDLNAYTTKEKTYLYASLRAEYCGRATELLTDIAFHATFPEKEIVKEQQVVSEEIDSYRDTPDEAIYEDFDQIIFPGHGLGHPILGTKESVKQFTQDKIKRHVEHFYTPDNMVYTIIGNVLEKDVKKLIDKYLRDIPAKKRPPYTRSTSGAYNPQTLTQQVSTNQSYEIYGGRAYSLSDDKIFPFSLMNNILGGPAMNSRLSLNIRERYGLAYSIYSFYSPFSDDGIWGVFYACEDKNRERIHRLVDKELKIFRNKKLGSLQLHQAKKQVIGQLTLRYEDLLTQLFSYSRQILNFGQLESFKDHITQIESVTAEQVQEVANEIFVETQLTQLTYLPTPEKQLHFS